MGSELIVDKYADAWDKLCRKSSDAKRYLQNIDSEKWTLFDDGGHRWGITTTNVSESFNNVFRGARRLPIRALAEATLEKTVAVFQRDWKRLAECHTALAPKYAALFEKYRVHARTHRVNCYSMTELWYKVYTESNNQHMVGYRRTECTCGKWQTLRFPCSHAIAVAYERGNVFTLVRKLVFTKVMQLMWTCTFRRRRSHDTCAPYLHEGWMGGSI